MAANNLRVIYVDKASSVSGVVSSTNALSNFKSATTTNTSTTVTITLSSPIAANTKFGVMVMLADVVSSITMSILTSATVVAATTIDTSVGIASTMGYGNGKYISCWSITTGSTSSVSISLPISPATNISRIIVGEYWSPTYNTSFGVQTGFTDASTNERTQAGDLYTIKAPRNKTLSFDLAYLSEADKFQFFNILKYCGKVLPLFISVFPADTDKDKEQMYQICGKFTELSTIANSMYTMYSSSVQVEEL